MPTYNAKSSFTAQGLVLRRMLYSELPLSREIFEALEKIHPATDADWEWVKEITFAPVFEARYLLTDKILAQMGFRQVFELASGLSPRGIAMAADPGFAFVEVDLPEEVAIKHAVIKNLLDAGAIKPLGANFHLLEGNVTEKSVFTDAAKFFRKEPVGVICEGLLRYLSFDDKAILARHVSDFLKEFGGAWITPDIELLDNQNQRVHRQVGGMRGVNVEENIFPDMKAAVGFFEKFGFDVRVTPLEEITDELVSPKKAGLTPEQAAERMDGRTMFTMTLK